MLFYWPSSSLPFSLPVFSVSLLSFDGFAFLGCGHRTVRVLIALSLVNTANVFLTTIITITDSN